MAKQGWLSRLLGGSGNSPPPATAGAAALWGTRAARRAEPPAAADPPAVLRATAEFVSAHPSDIEVLVHGLNGLLWLLTATAADFANETRATAEPPAAGGAAAQPSAIDGAQLLLAAAHGLSAFVTAETDKRAAAAPAATAACWLVRDVVSKTAPLGLFASWRLAETTPGPHGVAEAVSEALSRATGSPEVAGAACEALLVLLRADWCEKAGDALRAVT